MILDLFWRILMPNSSRGVFSRWKEIQLNSDTKIILMNPSEDLYFRFSRDLEWFAKLIKENADWISDEKAYARADKMIRSFLIYCIRQPENYKKKLLVEDGGTPSKDQEYVSDFNPEIEFKRLEEQGYPAIGDGERVFTLTPRMFLFNLIITESGWFTPIKAVQDVETFPADGEVNPEAGDSGAVRSEAESGLGPEQ